MKLSSMLVGIIVMAVSPGVAQAQLNRGDDVVQHCATLMAPGTQATFSEGTCAGAVAALRNAQTRIRDPKGRQRYCIPDGVTYGQVILAVTKGINSRPHDQKQLFVDLAIDELAKAWPCRK